MIFVANVRDYIVGGKVVLPANAVYVGRAVNRYGLKRSPLANPWVIGQPPHGGAKHRLTREEAIEFYRELLACRRRWDADTRELSRLRTLAAQGDLILVCWCHPKDCHARIIKELLEAGSC